MSRMSLAVAALSIASSAALTAQAPRPGTSALRDGPVGTQGSSSTTKTTIYGGIATGKGYLDLGIVGSVSFEFDITDAPVNVRVDPYIAIHSGSCGMFCDADANVIGVGGSAAYDFPTAQGSSVSWFVYGGLGVYRTSWSFGNSYIGRDLSSTDLGLQLGGGANLSGGWRAEARVIDIDYWSPLVLLFGKTLGGG